MKSALHAASVGGTRLLGSVIDIKSSTWTALAFWFKSDNTQSGVRKTVAGQAVNFTNPYWHIGPLRDSANEEAKDNLVSLAYREGGANGEYIADLTFNTAEWTHYVINAQMAAPWGQEIWMNGVFQPADFSLPGDNGFPVGVTSPFSLFNIGASGGTGNIFVGSISSFAIWKDRRLTSQEVGQLYAGRNPYLLFRPNLYRYWPLDDSASPSREMMAGDTLAWSGSISIVTPPAIDSPDMSASLKAAPGMYAQIGGFGLGFG